MINLHITTKGTSISVSNDTLEIISNEGTLAYAFRYVQCIFIHAGIVIDSDVIRKAYDRGVEIVFCREGGYPICSMYGPMYGTRAGLSYLQLSLVGTEMAYEMSAKWIMDKYTNRANVFIASNGLYQSAKTDTWLSTIRTFIASNPTYQEVFNKEAVLDKAYYSLVNQCLPMHYRIKRSEKRSNTYIGNAMLNYLYGMMYTTIERLIIKHKMDPYIGFHHGMAKGQKAFLFDVIEPYRPYCEEILMRLDFDNMVANTENFNGLLDIVIRKHIIDRFNEVIYKQKVPLIKKIDADIKSIAARIKKTRSA